MGSILKGDFEYKILVICTPALFCTDEIEFDVSQIIDRHGLFDDYQHNWDDSVFVTLKDEWINFNEDMIKLSNKYPKLKLELYRIVSSKKEKLIGTYQSGDLIN
jgi:hypothetical protein